MLTPEVAYERCLAITRREAKNFYYGIRLLPPPKRRAMSALYAFARYIDDIGDGDASPEEKLSQLASLREVTLAMAKSDTAHSFTATENAGVATPEGISLSNLNLPAQNDLEAVIAGVTYASREFPIPVGAFEEIIAGCEADSKQTSYQTIDDTVRYCRLVAGSVGRLSLGVFGSDAPGPDITTKAPDITAKIADDLGVALQLTNILRDIVEDANMGRVYLPAEDIAKFECSADLSGPRANVGNLVMFESERALEWFDKGFALLGHLDRRSRACVSAMSGIYFRLLQRIRRNPTAVLDGRMSLPTWEKSLVAARSLAGFRP